MNEVNLQNFNSNKTLQQEKKLLLLLISCCFGVYDGCVECPTSMATIAFEHHLVFVGLFSYKLSLHFTS
jgi:hypothetical protein